MEQMNDQRFDVEARHAAEAIAIYKAVTGKGEAAYSREKSRTKWELAAIAVSDIRRGHPASAHSTLSKIGEVVACAGRDWPDVPGEVEILRRVKWLARQCAAASANDREAARALPASMEPVAEIVECGVMGQQTVAEVEGAWKFLPIGTKLYAAARAAPESIREGEPYDNPAFEDLARTMGVWGTAQAALCAQFFIAGRGALPASMKPVAEIFAGDLFRVNQGPDAEPVTGDHDLYTAAQVQAMGRVPSDSDLVALASKHTRSVECATRYVTDAVAVAKEAIALWGSAAPRPPAAQERKPLTDEQIEQATGAKRGDPLFLVAKGFTVAIEAAHNITHPTGD